MSICQLRQPQTRQTQRQAEVSLQKTAFWSYKLGVPSSRLVTSWTYGKTLFGQTARGQREQRNACKLIHLVDSKYFLDSFAVGRPGSPLRGALGRSESYTGRFPGGTA